MKRIIFRIILVIAVSMVCWFIFKKDPVITNYPADDRTGIVMFGDSLVKGVGASKGKDVVSLLSGKLGESIVNMGVSGETSEEGLRRLNKVIEQKPKVVMILLGGNDFLKKVSREETFKNIDMIVDRLQASGSIVILLGVQSSVLVDADADEFERVAKEKGALYVPNVLAGIYARKEFLSDGIHPNDAGYEKMADKIYPALMKALK